MDVSTIAGIFITLMLLVATFFAILYRNEINAK
jgi:hypothetical protein